MGPDGRSKGCGIVEYQTVEEANRAIQQLSDTQLFSRCMCVWYVCVCVFVCVRSPVGRWVGGGGGGGREDGLF